MRTLRMWYGLSMIWLLRRIKYVVRKMGTSLKSFARKLEHWGDDLTPRWSLELFNTCNLAEAEIHLHSKVYHGKIDSIYQKFHDKIRILVVLLKAENGHSRREFNLNDYGNPHLIKDASVDCVWVMGTNGYIVIHFRSRLKK